MSQRDKHPRENTHLWSIIFFFHSIQIFVRGFKKKFEIDDLYKVVPFCESKKIGDKLEGVWKEELRKTRNPSLFKILFKCYGRSYCLMGIAMLVWKLIVTLWLPVALSKFISYFNHESSNETSYNEAIYYALVLIILSWLNLYGNYNHAFWQIELGFKMRNALCSLLYRKALRLNLQSLSQTSIGKITTIMTKDVGASGMFLEYGHNIWVGLVTTLILCYFIYEKIGIAAIAGISFFLIGFVLQILCGIIIYRLRLRSSKKTDERLEEIQETLSAIKVIKMYSWENHFINKINALRNEELIHLRKLFLTVAATLLIGEICNKIAFIFFIMTYIWLGNNITAELVYFITTSYGGLEFTLGNLIPYGVYYGASSMAAMERIQSVLQAPEIPITKPNLKAHGNPRIILKNVKVPPIFKNITMTIEKGLNVLVGQVGSGKTTFIKTILQEYEIKGQLNISGQISYASQEPWLFPATIKENILFGEEYSFERYHTVLEACALKYDLESFKNGDETIILDKGLNLSKGQQARINLARAIYRESDIYLLDDPLAALDIKVSDYIFTKCFRKLLKGKICIFVTNTARYINNADKIIVVEENNVKFTEDISLSCEENNYHLRYDNSNDSTEKNENFKLLEKEVYAETKETGKVSRMIYYSYLKYGGGIFMFLSVLVFFILQQFAQGYSEKVMSQWVNLEQELSNNQVKNESVSQSPYEERNNELNLYIILIISSVGLTLIKVILFYTFIKKASANLHKALIKNIVNAAMTIFDNTLIGNILNRFSQDFGSVDEGLPYMLSECLKMIFIMASSSLLLMSVSLDFIISLIFLIICSYCIKVIFQPAGRNLHRLQAITKSPMIGHINVTLEGLTTIRASFGQFNARQEYDNRQNRYISANYTLVFCCMALGYFLDLSGFIFLFSILLRFLLLSKDSNVGDVGLVISQSLMLTGIVTQGIKNFAEVENQMTSTERILEYIKLPTEDKSGKFLENWPKYGRVEFRDVSLSFDEKNVKVLNGIDLLLEKGQKLGIVGRTGAGKSSIISCLFRLYDYSGTILIDGVDIKTLSLNCLRLQIAVIPQDPVLFTGTIRDNFDPLGDCSDERIWHIIRELKLRSCIGSLNDFIDRSTDLSAGQKQLICLGRAILMKNKIIVLDEATANVDQSTDHLIVETIKNYFKKCTVIIIAHRLSSVMECDYVMVLNRGEMVEFDKPSTLTQNKNSFLYAVTKTTL